MINPLWSAREVRGRVEAVEPEGTDAVTVVIRGSAWSSHEPGQYVRVGVDIDGVRHSRSYSLSSAPDRPDGRITITVKAVAADCGTSLLQVGDAAGVLMPSGCRMGTCHSCVARLTCGRVRDLRTGHEHGDDELIQTCVSAAAGTVEIDL